MSDSSTSSSSKDSPSTNISHRWLNFHRVLLYVTAIVAFASIAACIPLLVSRNDKSPIPRNYKSQSDNSSVSILTLDIIIRGPWENDANISFTFTKRVFGEYAFVEATWKDCADIAVQNSTMQTRQYGSDYMTNHIPIEYRPYNPNHFAHAFIVYNGRHEPGYLQFSGFGQIIVYRLSNNSFTGNFQTNGNVGFWGGSTMYRARIQ